MTELFANLTPSEETPLALTAIDLFCGAGGLTEGFRQAGFQCLYANDSNQHAIETLSLNQPDVKRCSSNESRRLKSVRCPERTPLAEKVEATCQRRVRSSHVIDSMANESGSSKDVNPNVNCLDGKRCPKCGSYGPFEIVVSMRVVLYDSGSDNAKDGSIEYDDDAFAMCYTCQYEAIFGDFDSH